MGERRLTDFLIDYGEAVEEAKKEQAKRPKFRPPKIKKPHARRR